MMKTKEVTIEYNGSEQKVILKKMTFGEKNNLREEATDIEIVNNVPHVHVNQKKLVEYSLLYTIKEAPFKIDLETIQNLPPEIGEKLYAETDKLNSVTPEKKGNSSVDLNGEQQIQK